MSQQTKLKKTAVLLSLVFVSIMFIIKAIAFMLSGSVSVLASMIDSGSDLFTSAITSIAVFTSSKPADSVHRFGYGKAESVGALFQATFILISAAFLSWQAIEHIINEYETSIDLTTFIVMSISLILTIALVTFQRHVIKKTKSIAIKADSVNYTGDIFTTAGVIISLIITKYTGLHLIDAIFGIVIAVFLCHNAISLLRESLEILMDKEIDVNIKNKIKKAIREFPGIYHYHDFRSRSCGQIYFIEFHIELNGDQTFRDAHEISHLLKEKIKTLYQNMDITIHQDIHYE